MGELVALLADTINRPDYLFRDLTRGSQFKESVLSMERVLARQRTGNTAATSLADEAICSIVNESEQDIIIKNNRDGNRVPFR